MIGKLKDLFFFPIAYYFAFWARIQLQKWNPRVIVVTGSSGKTTLFSMVEAQLGDMAHYSHHANSAIGIPFDILNLHRKTLKPIEWIGLFLNAPRNAFRKPYKENIYVAECDADRPGEGQFLAKLLRPEITLWISTSRTHSMNFDKLIPGKFKNVEDAIAYEFGTFLEYTSATVVIDGDSELMKKQVSRTRATVHEVLRKDLESYKVNRDGTEFKIKGNIIRLRTLQPEESYYSIQMAKFLSEHLDTKFDTSFKELQAPPARSTVFRGYKNITILDSTYNANLSSMTAIINMFQAYPAKTKWAVIGDMLEQGKEEEEEHVKLAALILSLKLERIVLLGPRVKKYTYPILEKTLKSKIPIDVFDNPKDVLIILQKEIKGSETILFKGARFLEGVIENLLLDKKEKSKLARREHIWEERRKKWGL